MFTPIKNGAALFKNQFHITYLLSKLLIAKINLSFQNESVINSNFTEIILLWT